MSQHQNRQPEGLPTGGQYAATPRDESTASLTDAPQPAGPDIADLQADALAMYRDSLADKLEAPEFHSEDALAEAQERIDAIDRHLTDLAQAGRSPEAAFDRATDDYHAANDRVATAAVTSLVDLTKQAHPNAAYVELEPSDQSSGMWPGRVYDADGHELGTLADDDWVDDATVYGDWINQNGYCPDPRVEYPARRGGNARLRVS